MSWDITIQDLPDVASIDEVPEKFEPQPLGSRAEVINRIKASLPETDFSDPSWGVLEGPDWDIEFNIGDSDICMGVSLHVRGGGAGAPAVVHKVIDAVGGRGIDIQTSDFFSLDAAEESFAQWQDFRDQVLEQYRQPKPKGFFKRLFGLN